MSRSTFRAPVLPLVCAAALGLAPLAAQATDPGAGDDWQYSASLYLWGTDIDGQTDDGVEIDIDFNDILKNLKMAFVGAFEVRKSKWSVMADVIYLHVDADHDGNIPFPGPLPGVNVNVLADADVETWMVNLVGGYTVWQTQQGTLDIVAGVRFLHLDLDFDLGVNVGRLASPTTAGRLSRSIDVSVADGVWDGVVGVRGRLHINEKWYIPYYADVGAGDSELTWQALGGLGYRFSWGDVSATYRYIDWNVSDRKVDDFSFGGPLLAATFHW